MKMKIIRGIKKEAQRVRWIKLEALKVVLKLVLIFIAFFALYFILVDFLITSFLDWLGVQL